MIMAAHKPSTHRGITIVESDHPSGARTWVHEETGIGNIAYTRAEAIRQISRALGPDPACEFCEGHGTEDWPFEALVPCAACFPQDRVEEKNRRVG